jgi:fructose-1,6-bisphosphatase/inositol monophosphatase family enzyme
VERDDAGDTVYAIDRVSEERLIADVESEIAAHVPVVLMAEGLPPEGLTLPRGTPRERAEFRILVDPIDGTRGIMYQKRSAWILMGAAPERGEHTRLRDVALAAQTEIPIAKQQRADRLWAVRGQGAHAERGDLREGQWEPLSLAPSRARTIRHGFASISRFFPGARDVLAAVDERVVEQVLGPSPEGKALCFEDQYACTGGQLYELMMGHDRFIADLRPLLRPVLAQRGSPMGLTCHPYDICTALIAEEAGVAITDARGETLDAPLDIEANVAWAGYANTAIRDEVAPALSKALSEHGLL